MNNKLNLILVNTNYFAESDMFYLITDLTLNQATKIINPIVQIERKAEAIANKNDDEISEDALYTNEMLVSALKKAYPQNTIEVKDYLKNYKLIDANQYNEFILYIN